MLSVSTQQKPVCHAQAGAAGLVCLNEDAGSVVLKFALGFRIVSGLYA